MFLPLFSYLMGAPLSLKETCPLGIISSFSSQAGDSLRASHGPPPARVPRTVCSPGAVVPSTDGRMRTHAHRCDAHRACTHMCTDTTHVGHAQV